MGTHPPLAESEQAKFGSSVVSDLHVQSEPVRKLTADLLFIAVLVMSASTSEIETKTSVTPLVFELHHIHNCRRKLVLFQEQSGISWKCRNSLYSFGRCDLSRFYKIATQH